MPRPPREITDAQIAAVRLQAAQNIALRDIALDQGLSLTLVHQIVNEKGRFSAPTEPKPDYIVPSATYLAQWTAKKALRDEELRSAPQNAWQQLQLVKAQIADLAEAVHLLETFVVDAEWQEAVESRKKPT